MKSRIQHYLIIVSTMVLWACGPSQRELAVKQISLAKQTILSGDTLAAISKLDSVKILYPKAEVQIGVARNMNTELYNQLINKCQLALAINDSLIGQLETKFEKEKTEFDQYMQYIPKRQTLNRTWDRSFLQIHLDERGEMYLSSNYMGEQWLEHTGIRVYDGKLQAKTEIVDLDDPMNHRSDFLDYKWEKVTYMNGKSDSVIQFIAEHPTLNLKCVFLGKRYYYILLEDYDIQSVISSLELSKAIKRRKELADKIKTYQSAIGKL